MDIIKKAKYLLSKDLWILILDVIAVNLSYYLALVIRFYINGHFLSSMSHYVSDWAAFAPVYTVLAIIVFVCMRLYGGMWRFVGINDMNRIIIASLISSAVMVIGTLLFGHRMPITFYGVGGILQCVFVVLIRFAYRILLVEKKKLRRMEKIPALVIGSGELGRKAVRHLEDGDAFQPVRIIGHNTGRMLDGIPVVSFDDLEASIENVRAVFIADRDITTEQRSRIAAAAGDREVVDFTGAISNMTGAVPLTGLLEAIPGPLTVIADGQPQSYSSGDEALNHLHTRYLVTKIDGKELTVELVKDDGMAYLRQHQAETGEDLSFF